MKAQTLDSWEHIVVLDDGRVGCSRTMNEAARRAKGEWFMPLADDDLLLPGCLRALVDRSEGAHVVYSPPLVWGEAPDQFCMAPPGIPAVALIRSDMWGAGYDEQLGETEDRDLWTRLQEQNRIFVRADDEPTWVYRFHGGNKSRNHGTAF